MTDTIGAIGDAVSAHAIAVNEDSRIVTGWVVVVMRQGEDDEAGTAAYNMYRGQGQSYALTDGLVSIARRLQDDAWNLDDDDE